MLSASFDGTARVHGVKSGKTLKEFRGHTSYVNGACWSPDGGQVVTCGSDGTVRVWDAKTCEQLGAFRPPRAGGAGGGGGGGAGGGGAPQDAAVNAVAFHPLHPDRLFVCDRGPTLWVTNLQGQVLQALPTGRADGGALLALALSPRGEWAYALGDDGALYCFGTKAGGGGEGGGGGGGSGSASGGGGGGRLEHVLRAHDKGAIGVAHHPHRNLVATFASEGPLLLWKA